MSPRLTARAPAATTATACDAASVRDSRRASQRSGWAIGRTVPRSGQVPTTTARSCSARVDSAAVRWRTDSEARTRWVTSLAPIMITTRSARSVSTSSTWRPSVELCAPTTATLCNRTGRWASADSPSAIWAPGVSASVCTP